jgi:hypothetical protein
MFYMASILFIMIIITRQSLQNFTTPMLIFFNYFSANYVYERTVFDWKSSCEETRGKLFPNKFLTILHTPLIFIFIYYRSNCTTDITHHKGRYYFSLYFNMEAFSFPEVTNLVFSFSEVSVYVLEGEQWSREDTGGNLVTDSPSCYCCQLYISGHKVWWPCWTPQH